MPAFFSGISLWSLALLLAALGFLAAEVFHPGFGVPGVLGIACLVKIYFEFLKLGGDKAYQAPDPGE